jgi:hypothetical protein
MLTKKSLAAQNQPRRIQKSVINSFRKNIKHALTLDLTALFVRRKRAGIEGAKSR